MTKLLKEKRWAVKLRLNGLAYIIEKKLVDAHREARGCRMFGYSKAHVVPVEIRELRQPRRGK